ncbi:glycosyltransferase family 4 protein [Desulfurobacterium atlanticum]|uniref:Glycosyltransferase involved in cell wall bisynthesis n=1 Tax=Desulfurobacterium atlanticum TaxID=240169 RepID=A0A238XR75_9BACT|nr:glycosyltransferase family 1 protein [Desulfurobacterium atlanticum]SNR60834.1 Glycosyltransferase involved in cell wall bisynthesis [Desulfurobacterium atlanticum]
MNILINSRFLTQKITGTQRFAIEISLQLKKLMLNVVFVSPRNILHTKIANELNVKTIGVNTGHLWEQVDLPVYLKKVGNSLLINLVNAAPLIYKNQIITIHDLAFLKHPEWFSRKFYLFYRTLIPKIAKKAKIILTVSNFSKTEIINLLNIPSQKVEVIYNGISNKFSFNPSIKKENFILAVSSLDPRKNFKNLILAFKKLKLKEHKLLIVGSKNKVFSNQEIEQLIKETPNIEFTGYVPDEELVNLYQRAKLFVYPSLYEGFGLPPLEAMACGTPVVVSNVASLPEVCGDAAYYVNPYDVNDIAKGIETVLKYELLQKELIKKGLERVKLFSWEKSAEKLAKIIEEVVQN